MLALQIKMDLWSLIASLFSILHTVHTDTTRTSKACYGTHADTLPCTTHYINCNSIGKIVICDAYFTKNTVCGLTGLPSCPNNLDQVTEHGYLKFNSRELAPVYKNCSREPRCAYPAPRRGEGPNFSVVKYHCIENQTVKFFNKSEICQRLNETDGKTDGAAAATGGVGAAVGGVVASVLAVLFIVLVTVWYLRKRRDNTGKNEKKSTNCRDQKAPSIPCNISQSHYQEIEDLNTRGDTSDYDYASADGIAASPNMNNYFTIDPITKPNTTPNPSSSATEDDYDHIGDKPTVLTSNYDTTASVAQSAGTEAHSREDDYGYNLLQEAARTKTVQNDYDTTASANKAVAQLGKIEEKTAKDDYDHFPVTNTSSETLSSYTGKVRSRSDDYAFAGPLQ